MNGHHANVCVTSQRDSLTQSTGEELLEQGLSGYAIPDTHLGARLPPALT